MDTEQVKRYSIMEVVLLLLLLVGMFCAWLIVKARSRVMLSEAILLDGSGVSVRVPAGAGWEHTPAWIYENDSSMALLAQRRIVNQTEIELRWRYILSAPPMDMEEVLQQRLANTGSRIDVIEMPPNTLMQAARINTPPGTDLPAYYIAMAQLDYGRTIELQVLPERPDYDPVYAETLLRDTAASLHYELPEELTAGTALLRQFFTTAQLQAPRQDAYIISESRGPVGFFYAGYSAPDQQGVQRIESRQYDAQQFMMESTLTTGRDENPFEWQTRITVPMAAAMRIYDIERQDNTFKVTSNYEKEKTLYVQYFVLPELLMPDFVRLYMDSGRQSAVIDVLAATGALVPVRLTSIVPQDAAAHLDGVTAVVQVQYLHSEGFVDEFYFDAQQKPVGRFERQPRRPDHLWRVSDVNALRQLYGERMNIAAPAPKKYF